MIDLSSLSPEEIKELEKQIEKYKKTEKFLTGYKVTFYVKFNVETHKESDIDDPESFADWLCNAIPDEIIASFALEKPEDVSGIIVEEVSKEELKKVWAD